MTSNIIVFFTDDHAQWALPCYGNSEIISPTLNYLAQTGVTMMNAFTPTPVCSPARASFWTGLYPSQHGIHDHIAEDDDDVEITPWMENIPTLATYLQESGYYTGLCGKWHCGAGEEHKLGFDYWYSAWRKTPKYYTPTSKYSDHGNVIELGGYDTQIITDGAIRFLRERDEERPFFLFVGYATAHSPWMNRAERLVSHYRNASFTDIPDDIPYPFGRSKPEGHKIENTAPKANREKLAQYYASVTHIDEMVGRVLDELDAQDQRDDTLVVYTSDHGLNLGHHHIWGKGNGSRPLNMLDESIRIPLIINHKNVIKGGQVRTEFTNHTDLFTTVLEYANALPDDFSQFPGKSFKSLLLGDLEDDWENVYIGEYGTTRVIRNERYKLILRYPEGEHILIDMQNDPREVVNLYAQSEYNKTVEELKNQIISFFEKYEAKQYSGLNGNHLPKHNAHEAWRT
jgi:choline-sulfatase